MNLKPEHVKVGLALGGGVVRGMAHLGVLATLNEAGIRIDYASGTSAGSIIASLYCAGLEPTRIKELGLSLRWRDIARPVWPRRGFVSFAPLEQWYRRNLGDPQFSDLKTPLAVIATDLQTGFPVELRQGSVARAVHASCAIPGFVNPVEVDGKLLGDGSLADTLPVGVLRRMGAQFVIGVDIFPSTLRPRWGPFGLGFTAIEILVQRAGGGIDQADCLIAPQLAGSTYTRFSKREALFELGYQAAVEKLPAIREALQELELAIAGTHIP